MFFRRKPKNRRLEREHVLDVKLRSGQVRAARTRLATMGLGAGFATLFGLYLIWRLGGWALDHFVYENKAFAVREIIVQTDGVIAEDQLRRWAGIQPDQNLLALDLARVKRDLELIPFIQMVSVERILPHTLRLRVSERESIAQISVPRLRPVAGVESTVFHLDPEGWVMPPLDPRQRVSSANSSDDQLPVVFYPHSEQVQAGRRLAAPQVQAALELIAAFEHSPMVGLADLHRIDASAPDVLVVTTGQGSEVTFGLADLEQQLRRWHKVFDEAQKKGKAIGTLDLAVSNNIPARWLEASAVPLASPKLPKPIRVKKKHV
jgi:cell division septal protein FtsQ